MTTEKGKLTMAACPILRPADDDDNTPPHGLRGYRNDADESLAIAGKNNRPLGEGDQVHDRAAKAVASTSAKH